MQVAFEGRRGSTSDRLKPAPVFKQPVTFHYAIHNHTTRMQKLTKAFQVYRLMALTVFCVFAGISIGLLCRPHAKSWPERTFMYIELPGELYLRFLRLMILPLLVSNVILSFGTIQGKISSRLGKVAGFLYLASNLTAITLAILVAVIIRPGGGGGASGTSGDGQPGELHRQHDFSIRLIADNFDKVANHHLLQEYHDSMARYREYHPMFYHTNPDRRAQASRRRWDSDASTAASAAAAAAADGRQQRRQQVSGEETQSLIKLVGKNQIGHPSPPPQPDGQQQQQRPQVLAQIPKTTTGQLTEQHNIELELQLTSAQLDDQQEQLAQLVRAIEAAAGAEAGREGSGESSVNPVGVSTRLPIDVILDVLRNLIPDSLVGAALQQSRTRLFTPNELKLDENGSTIPPPGEWQMGHELVNQPNIIGLLAMSVLTGVVLSHMDEASRPLLDLCSCVSELSLRVGMKAIHMAPVCIMFLLISQVSRATDLNLIAGELFMYAVTVTLALLLHGFLVLPAVYYFVTKKSPLRFFKGLIQALVAAFATSSSSATMALTLNCLSDLDVNLIIVRAFGPLGSVFNMNGTSIFEAVAVTFVAQMLGVRLPTTSLLLIGLCSAIASLSTSGIPSSGVMTLVIALNAINLPVLELSLIYIVDFIIDRFRTVVNVWSGAIVCGLIDHICPEELFEEEMGPEKYQEMIKYRGSRTSLTSRKMSQVEERKPQVISVTITPPPVESSNI